jgi:hypothetical protein
MDKHDQQGEIAQSNKRWLDFDDHVIHMTESFLRWGTSKGFSEISLSTGTASRSAPFLWVKKWMGQASRNLQ